MVVRKKDAEGNYTDFRQCGDYRPLNMETTLDRYPLPGIEDIFNQRGGYNSLQAGSTQRVPPDASEGGGSVQDGLLGGQSHSMGVVSGPLWTQECPSILSEAHGLGAQRPSFLSVLHR